MVNIKDCCNKKYFELLEALKNNDDLQKIHNLLFEIVDNLLEVGKIYPLEKDKCQRKAIFLVKIAKEIKSDSIHKEIYFKLTGTRLGNEAENLRNELDELKARNENLIEKKNISSINEIPDIQKNENNNNIRPMRLKDYIGQERVKAQLEEAIAAAKIKNRPLEHLLLYGSAGLGKTSLSKIVANELNSKIIIMSGPTIKDPMSLVSVVKNIQRGDILFIDEIHRINPLAAEAIYTVMEDFELSYIQKDKNESRNITLKLPPFTVIGATTHSGLLEKPMRDRFTLQFKLELYKIEEIKQIAISTMSKLGKNISEEAALSVAKRSRGVPRNCNSFIQRLYDRALVRNIDEVDLKFTDEYFKTNGVDENGLTDIDFEYLNTIYSKFGNRPVGIDNLSSCLGEGKNIIENQIEPYLLYLGLIQITPSGRIITQNGINYVNKYINDR